MYCFWGTGHDDYAPCKKLSYVDIRLQCALLEPLSINNAEIPIKATRLMRNMNCIPETQCNMFDKNSNYYASCERKITSRI